MWLLRRTNHSKAYDRQEGQQLQRLTHNFFILKAFVIASLLA
ncbi:MAG: hypothetical protein ACK4E8_07790 [Lacibacter sp.]|jgi:hypothetical protein